MAFSVKITGMDRVKKAVRDRTKKASVTSADKIGQTTIRMMKDHIAKGNSPIAGYGRFPAYKQSYKDQIEGKVAFYRDEQKRLRVFPPRGVHERFRGKKIRPVNLKLSGDFLSDLTWSKFKERFGTGVRIRFKTKKSRLKEKGHREGANGQGIRPIIPEAGENFRRDILDKIVELYRRALGAG